MEVKLCGTCSQEKGLSQDERIEIAMSRVPMTLYKCPTCEKEHALNRSIKRIEVPSAPVISENKTTKVKSKKKEREDMQLTLF